MEQLLRAIRKYDPSYKDKVKPRGDDRFKTSDGTSQLSDHGRILTGLALCGQFTPMSAAGVRRQLDSRPEKVVDAGHAGFVYEHQVEKQ